MVSIITPSFNSEKYIDATYQSILRQSFKDWEWLIVDDGSTDATLQLLQQYAHSDARIKYFTRDVLPKGATTCRNIAVQKSKAEYLIFLDTDDIMASLCLEQRVREMINNPGYDFIVFQMMQFNEKPGDCRVLWNIEDDRDDLERAIRLNPVMAGSSTMWKKESFIKIGMWDDRILINQDIELHIRSMAYGLKYLLKLDLPPDLFVRNNQQSISRAKKKPLEKQLSRVYYFSKIIEHLKKNNLLDKHRSAAAWLFLKIFFDLLYDKEIEVAKKMYRDNKEIILLLPKHYQLLCRALLLSKYFGHYGVAQIRLINRQVLHFKNSKHETFGKEKYTGIIEY